MCFASESARHAATAAVVALAWVPCGAALADGVLGVPPARAPWSAVAAESPPRVTVAAPASLPAGTRVRVEVRQDEEYRITLSRRREIGAIAAWSADSLRVDRGARGTLAIPLAAIERIDVSRGPSVWGGIGRGAAIGLLGAVVVAFPILDRQPGDETGIRALYLIGGALIVGPTVGAAVGAAFPTERWERRR